MPSKHVLFAVSYQWIKYIANLLPRHALPLAAYLSWDNLCLHCHFSNLKWITALNTRAMKYSDASSAVMKPDEHVLNAPTPHLRSCHEGIQCPIYCSWCPFDLSFFFWMVHNFNLAWHTSSVSLWVLKWGLFIPYGSSGCDGSFDLENVWLLPSDRTSVQIMMLIKVVHKMYKVSSWHIYCKIIPINKTGP